MERPFGHIASLGKSGTQTLGTVIALIRARTLSITIRLKCGASLDANPKVSLYFTPDGKNYDTIAYTSFELTYSAGNWVQRTIIIDPPEHGALQVRIENQSSADTITMIDAWQTIQAYNISEVFHEDMRKMLGGKRA